MPAGLRPSALTPAAARQGRLPAPPPFRDPLPIPRELRAAKLEIPIREAEVPILPELNAGTIREAYARLCGGEEF